MGRQKQPEIAAQLLEACTDHALAHGLPDRLEPFARATGASTRMLIYHFGSRDRLRRAVLQQARARQLALFGALLHRRDAEPYPVTLRRAFAQLTGPQGRPFLELFGRLREDAEQQLWPGFRREATTDWLEQLEAGMRSTGRPDHGTVVLAVIRGLVLDLEATGDVRRVRRAFGRFLDALQPPG